MSIFKKIGKGFKKFGNFVGNKVIPAAVAGGVGFLTGGPGGAVGGIMSQSAPDEDVYPSGGQVMTAQTAPPRGDEPNHRGIKDWGIWDVVGDVGDFVKGGRNQEDGTPTDPRRWYNQPISWIIGIATVGIGYMVYKKSNTL